MYGIMGFKSTYIITYTGKTEAFHYEDLELQIDTPYDWKKPHDLAPLFELIRLTIQKDFDKYELLRVEKVD